MLIRVDGSEEVRQALVAPLSDLSQAIPELVFEIDACVMPCNENRMLGSFHDLSLAANDPIIV